MPVAAPRPETWIKTTSAGLYCEPGDFHIDPLRPVPRAVITHGHGDHARAGNDHVLATRETIAIMQARYADGAARSSQPLAYDKTVTVGEVAVRLVPAGHVLGSAQIVLDYHGSRVVVSGDYKRRSDPTCAPFEPVNCDLFITEATFGLPVFRHPPDDQEIAKLLHSLILFPERCHLVGVYVLGKCQRVLALLRRAGYQEPVYLHGALIGLTGLFERFGIALGAVLPATGMAREALKGRIVLAPPSAAAEPWSRRLPDPLVAQASGWMRVRQRAKASGVELPLVISDHADWDELIQTLDQVAADEIWVTHGREEALVHYATKKGYHARALALAGFEEDE
ncbi:MAG TPA: ligase-associated DNA damage response exonuclease [Stellaceae bacterium]|nr:ligase-associated DNA damage response exonuclease [Stellaceae bacterium]HUC09522.1 ligase-associated DNA damage response exonuclease [Stellaceae bacterium]